MKDRFEGKFYTLEDYGFPRCSIDEETVKAIAERYERHNKEMECIAYSGTSKGNILMIKSIKDLDLLKEWIIEGYSVEKFYLLENMGIDMNLAFNVVKIMEIMK